METVGVIGGGQLAWMMAEEAKKLGIKLIVQTPNSSDPAVSLSANTILGAIDDIEATSQLASLCDVITFENEFVNLEALQNLAQQGVCFRPRLEAIAPLLDKLEQRRLLDHLGLCSPRFIELNPETPPNSPWGFPAVLKARRHGYDGKGTFIIQSQTELEETLKKVGPIPMLLEEFIPFKKELAVMVARSASGEIVVYPVVETQQKDQVCHYVIAPAMLDQDVLGEINIIARSLLTALDVVGIYGIEFFLDQKNYLCVNEIAPRTHNSGHYTLDASVTSQFAMQLQAVTGRSLGSAEFVQKGAVMVNLLGYENSRSHYLEKRAQIEALPNTYVHWYGKSESHPGRKLGHVTVILTGEEIETPQAIAEKIETLWFSH